MGHPVFLATQLVSSLNAFINESELNRITLTNLLLTQIPVAEKLEKAKTYKDEDGDLFCYALGILNGVVGVDANNIGYIGVTFRLDGDIINSFHVLEEHHRNVIFSKRKNSGYSNESK